MAARGSPLKLQRTSLLQEVHHGVKEQHPGDLVPSGDAARTFQGSDVRAAFSETRGMPTAIKLVHRDFFIEPTVLSNVTSSEPRRAGRGTLLKTSAAAARES